MSSSLTPEELEKKRAEIDSRPPEEPTAGDLAALAEADAEDPAATLSLEEYKAQREYSGKLALRIPKELHRYLAEAAKENGVSLNQYALYKPVSYTHLTLPTLLRV